MQHNFQYCQFLWIQISLLSPGTSDPYVKFKLNGRLLHKSKTVHRDLNPVWDETFVVPIEDPFQSIHIKVFDYDWGLQDDFMGSAELHLTSLELSRTHELTVKLEDPSRPVRTGLGELKMNVTLWPRTQEDKEQVSSCQFKPWIADTTFGISPLAVLSAKPPFGRYIEKA